MANTTDGRPSSKVARLIDEYELDGLGAEMEARWTGDGEERMSFVTSRSFSTSASSNASWSMRA